VTTGAADIERNSIRDSGYGIVVGDGADSTVSPAIVSVHSNNIVRNSKAGLWNQQSRSVDATRNWWGDRTGPKTLKETSRKGNSALGSVL